MPSICIHNRFTNPHGFSEYGRYCMLDKDWYTNEYIQKGAYSYVQEYDKNTDELNSICTTCVVVMYALAKEYKILKNKRKLEELEEKSKTDDDWIQEYFKKTQASLQEQFKKLVDEEVIWGKSSQ